MIRPGRLYPLFIWRNRDEGIPCYRWQIINYQINGETGGGEGEFLKKTQTVATMKSYFGDFKILMQKVKEFGKPVYVLLEADGFGYLEMQSNNINPAIKYG